MPRTASPIVFPAPHRSYTDFEQSFMHDDRYTCWYERTVMHWTNHKLDWFYQEELVVQEKETGRYFWPHKGQLVPVVSLKETMSFYFFEAPKEYEDLVPPPSGSGKVRQMTGQFSAISENAYRQLEILHGSVEAGLVTFPAGTVLESSTERGGWGNFSCKVWRCPSGHSFVWDSDDRELQIGHKK